MTARRTRAGGAAGLLVGLTVLAGCTGAPTPPTPTPTPAAPPSAPSTSAQASADDRVCAAYTDQGSVVRRVAAAIQAGPVLPAGIALFLLDARQIAATPGVQDPVLAAAQAELIAAIDDLDAQGRTAIGPDGDPAQNAVQLDAARITNAVTEIERVCGQR